MLNEDPLYGNVSIRQNVFLSAFANLVQLGYEVNKEKNHQQVLSMRLLERDNIQTCFSKSLRE